MICLSIFHGIVSVKMNEVRTPQLTSHCSAHDQRAPCPVSYTHLDVYKRQLLFDPFSEEDITRALLQAVQDPALLGDLRIKGTQRIEQGFPSPDKIARMFYTVYRHAAKASLDLEQQQLLREMLS